MRKKIDWLADFANSEYKKMQKTASLKTANQVIVDRSAFPNVKVGTLVDYKQGKYKVVDTDYYDKGGPGLMLEEVACGESPTNTGEVKVQNGTVEASIEEDDETANCGDVFKTASKIDDVDDIDLDSLDDSKEKAVTAQSDYPDTVPQAGGVHPIPSAPIEGPGQKKITDPPYHPSYDPGESASLDPEWDDVGFGESAKRTQEIIRQEDEQDRTTVEGHFTWNKFIDTLLGETSEDEVDELASFDDSANDDEEEEDTEDIPEDFSDEEEVKDDAQAAEDVLDEADLDLDLDSADDADEVNEDVDETDEDIDIDLDLDDATDDSEDDDLDLDAADDEDLEITGTDDDDDLDIVTEDDEEDLDLDAADNADDTDEDEGIEEIIDEDEEEPKKEASVKSRLSRLAQLQ